MFNRVAKFFQSSPDDEASKQALRDRCDEMAEEMAHDRDELEAGHMSVEEFDAKY